MIRYGPGDKVASRGLDGVVVAEYAPGMYEVSLAGGVVIAPVQELDVASGAPQPGDHVTYGGASGVVVAQYSPGLCEVRMDGHVVTIAGEELRRRS